MVKKYYAVKKGRHPGIYKTWAECQKEVNGYPNAKFKSFLTLKGANEWLQATGNTVPSTKAVDYSDNILVYTDGGSRNHGNKLGQHVRQMIKRPGLILFKLKIKLIQELLANLELLIIKWRLQL